MFKRLHQARLLAMSVNSGWDQAVGHVVPGTPLVPEEGGVGL